jgi:hypothetical protein
MASWKNLTGLVSLEEQDPDMFEIIEREKHRLWTGMEGGERRKQASSNNNCRPPPR